jgi:hypothetical protein
VMIEHGRIPFELAGGRYVPPGRLRLLGFLDADGDAAR